MNPKVDEYLNENTQWREEFEKLRTVLLECGLTEELKWKKPCYTFEGNNIAILQGFKKYCAIMFFKGALLKDRHDILIRPGENSQAQRQIRFTNAEEINEVENAVKDYIQQAIDVEKAGLKVEFKKTSEFTIPDELHWQFEESPELKTAFESLTPGRQRGYIHYFSKAKKSETRTSRIEKYKQHILNGKGFHD